MLLAFAGRHRVLYDDGEVEQLFLSAETVRWDKRPNGYMPPSDLPAQTTEGRSSHSQHNGGALREPEATKRDSNGAGEGPSPSENKEEEEARLQVRNFLSSRFG